MVTSHEEQQATHHPTFMQYVLVAVILFAITIVEFVLIYDKVGIDWERSDALADAKIPVLIGLSAIKFAIVIMFYMHLKFESRLFTGIFLAGLGLAFAAGLAVLAIFVAIEGEPREFAEANAVPYVEEGHEPAGEESPESKTSEPTGPINLHVGVQGDTLEFDTNSFTATAGSEVVLTFSNESTINQHNWVLVPPGTKDAVAADGALAGPANDWVPPNDERVLFHTKLLDPGETEEIRFTLESGTYQFVCTFPGHNLTMFGDFAVTEATAAEGATTAEAAVSEIGESGGATGLQVGVQGDALEFDTGSLTATAGSEVVLTFNNVSTINQHNWVLVRPGTKDAVSSDGTLAGPTNDWTSPGDDRVLFHTRLLNPGETAEIRFTPDAGTYQFVCTFPGHNLTMFGDFEVTQATSGG